MPRKRSTYTAEFKLQAVRMITDRKLAVAEVSRRLGVTEGCLRAWRQAAEGHGDAAFPAQEAPTPADDEFRRLRAEVARLKAERDLLNQAAELTFRFTAENAGVWPVAWMCAALEVSESGYRAWAARPRHRPRGGGSWSGPSGRSTPR